MTNKLQIALAAGLLLAGPAFADDQEAVQTKDQVETRDQTRLRDGTGIQAQDRVREHADAGLGTQVRELARDQATGVGATGIGEQVREMARDPARERVHSALASQAGMPVEPVAVPGAGTGERAAERHAAMTRKAETERAALRHTERKAARGMMGEGQGGRRGMGAGGHGGMGQGGMGQGSGDCRQAAETTRGGMHGSGGTGGMMGSGGMR